MSLVETLWVHQPPSQPPHWFRNVGGESNLALLISTRHQLRVKHIVQAAPRINQWSLALILPCLTYSQRKIRAYVCWLLKLFYFQQSCSEHVRGKTWDVRYFLISDFFNGKKFIVTIFWQKIGQQWRRNNFWATSGQNFEELFFCQKFENDSEEVYPL